MRLLFLVLLAILWTTIIPTSAKAQGQPPLEAWVDPFNGSDPGTGQPLDAWVNDPSNPYKKLQTAILGVRLRLEANHDATSNPNQQGIVYALPGVYGTVLTSGSNSIPSSGDTLPIYMVDRVHVQGLGARTTIIRGIHDSSNPNASVFWPDQSQQHLTKEVLVSYRRSNAQYRVFGTDAPWSTAPDTMEMLDGFTLQGGDIQVLVDLESFGLASILSAKISNCVFDMRDGWSTQFPNGTATNPIEGPTFGLMMVPLYTQRDGTTRGYFDYRVFAANNTFIMAEWLSAPNMWRESKPNSVAVIDVTDRTTLGGDSNTQLRGLTRPFLVNNLIRTSSDGDAANQDEMAMMGISTGDATARGLSTPEAPQYYFATNAFALPKAGSSNAVFSSIPVQTTIVADYGNQGVLVDGSVAVPVATPKVGLWNGPPGVAGGIDPGFVGEYLKSAYSLSGDRDWRLLPGSPLEDQGMWDVFGLRSGNGWDYTEPTGPGSWKLATFDRDGEWYGNLRVVNAQPDIGFDEVQLFIMSGSYANDSTNHGRGSFMNPSVPNAPTTRYFIVRRTSPVPTMKVTNGTFLMQAAAPTAAWDQPPRTLSQPLFDHSLPAGFNAIYISQQNSGGTNPTNPNGWTPGLVSQPWPNPTGVPSQDIFQFMLTTQADDDSSGATKPGQGYFNTQIELHVGSSVWYSNLQWEYR